MDKERKQVETAKEALELAKEKAKTFSEVIDMVDTQAQYGNTFIAFPELLSREAETKLKDNGFMIGTVKDQFNQRMIKVSWLEAE